jgi:hypothetical protein
LAAGEEVEGDVDDEVFLSADQAAASGLEEQGAHVDPVLLGCPLGVPQEGGVDACVAEGQSLLLEFLSGI